ncbi:MAG TPA: radical SAM protein [Paludibacteraceae bacterium]|nr:radical SAM protein [Paludibacteraceae bacterium]HQF49312.1 radical SAM protein [Paludibacteraceae bacterium]HQJ90998.1 radical SAM protein [Paludibacteraceae bacterium]
MATFLFDSIVFGPIKSRRLGISLGVNLLPCNVKLCSFDCVYCECGMSKKGETGKLPTREEVKDALKLQLSQMKSENKKLDVITFAGNGEPTLHHQFAEIIDDAIELRNVFFPNAKVSVLSNSTMVHKQSVFDALNKVDNNILKLDSAIDSTVKLIDDPHSPDYSVASIIEQLKRFKGNFILQTIFLRGYVKGHVIDNTTDEEVSAWIEAVKEMNPKEIMIYAIDRDTPIRTLEKISHEELEKIAERVRKEGYKVDVA